MSKEKRRKENDEELEGHRQKERERKEESRERKHKGEKGTKEHKDSRKSWSRKRTPAYYQHEDRLDVSYSSRATSLDRARTNEVAQQGAPMCDTNAMMQAQQQQLPYLPPNYPGLPMVGSIIGEHSGTSTDAIPSAAISHDAISTGAGAVLPSISGPARSSNAASDDNSANP
uniref:Uncharacterized protein n=1 Tax=Romanomermis culicivorax TaxID=13658 RepID=A0A915I9T0_ROMCU